MFKFFKNLAKFIVGLPLAICATVLIGASAMFFTGWSIIDGHMRRNKGAAKSISTDKSLAGIADALWGALGAVWGFTLDIVREPTSAFADYSLDAKTGSEVFQVVNTSTKNEVDEKDNPKKSPAAKNPEVQLTKNWKNKAVQDIAPTANDDKVKKGDAGEEKPKSTEKSGKDGKEDEGGKGKSSDEGKEGGPSPEITAKSASPVTSSAISSPAHSA